MKAIEIISGFLKMNGYDGLCNPDRECGCEIGDLAPCSEYFAACEPAYKIDLPPGDERGAWLMVTRKE